MINAMKKDDEWIGFVVSFANEQYFDLLTKLHTWRAKKGIRSRVIMNEKHKDQGEIREKLPNTTVKYVSDEMQTPAIINVAGNITLLNIMAEDVTVFMIDNKDVADSFRNQFEKLWNQRVYTYQGVEQIKDLIRQTLDFGDYEVFAEGMKIIDVLGRDFFLWWQNEKKKRHIKSRGIMGEKYMDMPTVRDSTTQFGFLPEFENPGLVFVFNDKVANVILSKDPVAFLIDNKDVADNQRNYFDLLWNESTRTYKGYDAFKRVWRESLDMGDTLYWIGAKGYFFDNRLKDAMEIVDIARKKGMRWKNVVDESTRGHAITKLDIVETRYFKEKITAPGVFWIIGSRIMISNWAKEEPILVVIDNKEIADSYKNYFDILWKMAKA